MILKKLSMVAVLMGLLGMGCKNDCEKLCEDSLACDPDDFELNPELIQQEDDCSDDCDEDMELIEASGCEPEWDDLVLCLEGLDICDPDDRDECESEYADLTDCTIDYCDYGTSLDDIADAPPECD
jgi:hypothetical protein